MALAISLVPVETNAAPIVVSNFSFETPVLASGAFANGSPEGWTGGGGFQALGVENPDASKFVRSGADLPAPAAGINAAFINAGGGGNALATLTSSASVFSLTSDTNFTLTVAVGNALGEATQRPGSFSLSLFANGVSVATTGLIDASTEISDGTFRDFSLMLTAETVSSLGLAGQSLTLQLAHKNTGPNGNAQIFFDNVRLDASAVPEPGTLALLFGAMGVFILSRCKRRLS